MTPRDLETLYISITVSDPWDFVSELTSGPFNGKIIKICDDNAAVVQLEEEVRYKDYVVSFLWIAPRHVDVRLADLLQGIEVFCNMIPVDRGILAHANPCDTSWWRGGLSLIATVKLADMRIESAHSPVSE